MPIEVTARHIDADQETQQYAKDEARRILNDFPRVEHIRVILDKERYEQLAEVIVQAKDHIRVEAKESTDTLQVSIDKAFAKVARQLRKERDKVQDHRHSKSSLETERLSGVE